MKGSPIRELLLVAIAGLVALWPLISLTSDARPESGKDPVLPSSGQETVQMESWIEFKLSHPPEHLVVLHEGRLILESAGEVDEDLDAALTLKQGVVQLEVSVVWPEDVEQGYLELTVEPGTLPTQKDGAWGEGRQEELFEFSWQVPDE